MPNPVLAELRAAVAEATSVQASAVLLLDGFGERMDAAVAAAIANGATAEEMEPVTTELAAFKASTTDLSRAVSENT